MNHITLSRPRHVLHWLKIYSLYRSAFPSSERKPFTIIFSMYRRQRTDLWCILRDGKLAGFAATVNSPDTILLDYLAIAPQCRNQGIGTAALLALKEQYSGRGLFVEIEDTHDPGPDQALRRSRKQFYEAAGMVSLDVTAMVFGVKMELLGWDCQMDFSAYKAFYSDHYNSWAAEHILSA